MNSLAPKKGTKRFFGIVLKVAVWALVFSSVLILSFQQCSASTTKPLKVEKADDWTELFNRMEPGWMGADGIYSLPLNGRDSKVSSATDETITFFTFCDSFLGSVDQRTLRFNDFRFSHNTAAILRGSQPDKDKIEFFYGKNGSNKFYNSNFENSLYGYNLWPQDCIIIDDVLHILGFRVDNSMFTIGVDEVRVPLVDGIPDFNNFTVKRDLPLFIDGSKYETFFGGAILDNTEEAGAMNPDGYVYIYGTKTNKSFRLDKKLVVARVKKEDFGDINKWRFYDGQGWKEGVNSVDKESAALTDRISNEHSVTPIETGIYAGKYMLVFSHDYVEYRIGDTPYGPFGPAIKAYKIPEPDIYENATTYNAKAHPHLSKPGELLISYNVNLSGSFPSTNEIYRPRFISLNLNEFAEEETKSNAKTNVAKGKSVTASHGENTAHMAVDGRIRRSERWSGQSEGDKWLMVDLGSVHTLYRWVVKHASAGGEITAFNTRSFKLQKSMDGTNWTDVDVVDYSIEPVTDRSVKSFDARYVRLYITKPSQSNDTATRIYEFELYGEEKKDETAPDETIPDKTVPDETKPDETMPDETKPDDTLPDETQPQDPSQDDEETPTPTKKPADKDKTGNTQTPDDGKNSPKTYDNAINLALLLAFASISIISVVWYQYRARVKKHK